MMRHQYRVQVLKQLAAWSPEQRYGGAKVYLWERPFKNEVQAAKHREAVAALENLLVTARVKVIHGETNPSSIPVVTLQQLNQLDGVILQVILQITMSTCSNGAD